MILVDKQKITSNEAEVPNTGNNFFSSIKKLKIPDFYVDDRIPHSSSRLPTFKAIPKYKNNPSLRMIKGFSMRFTSFYFSQIGKNTVLKEVRKSNTSKAGQDTDIQVKILKEMLNILLNIFAFNLTKQYVHQNVQHSNLLTQHLFANKVPEIKRIATYYLKNI